MNWEKKLWYLCICSFHKAWLIIPETNQILDFFKNLITNEWINTPVIDSITCDGNLLTVKFGKPKVTIGLDSLSATASRNQPMGVIKSPIVGFLLYSVKEINLLKEAYL